MASRIRESSSEARNYMDDHPRKPMILEIHTGQRKQIVVSDLANLLTLLIRDLLIA